MTNSTCDAANIIEPFDSKKHDRTAFSCGVQQVDNFFKTTANKLAEADNTRVFVMTSPDAELIGFYALNSHSVDYTLLPKKYARTRPGHGNIPSAYISMIGVDTRFMGKGYGGDLLVDALRRIALAAREIGIAVVLLDVLDCGDPDTVERRKKLYTEYGFTAVPSNELRLFLPVRSIQPLLEQYEAEEAEVQTAATSPVATSPSVPTPPTA
ncbi:GNAT family N-acetyltransferase [Bradyrhizobium japonicum]|uniref:GNAT family N-acetyltransferase n=1 Tax=Bradyrhizobium japonicum TaxID=375 RepID=UPI0020A1737E|nr:GNAT family N-acetyltransferase [Bradyrhizobium japonicum]MCP1765400.1 ribosomal protein S18 acetylase RimI-like enzyme [Bradyrhizobium japonicum]MCP1787538.1 ribosomal protein S18 acetylase RimI-like enzyme [Bradyrhizobium japonicum]MCP1809414.1 ribosomal protein S18 acetylase RimI-like enzyme [Bradyrhizobium japonicum]MCP1818347.1 ribosomal protein S18 acetylase RimI-like enzyme [Bradyrhizobium japonicum]MCP1870143.1 ribosomal protein S18 acetylase RimI-like enzyme [Bradyrhizobium japonic